MNLRELTAVQLRIEIQELENAIAEEVANHSNRESIQTLISHLQSIKKELANREGLILHDDFNGEKSSNN